MNAATARAPGKAVLGGEYAVLDGAPAVVVAVDRTVRAWWDPSGASATPHSPFTVAAMEQVARWLEGRGLDAAELVVSGRLGVDSSGLYDGTSKIGLGSSAAVTVAAMGAALAAAGIQLDDTMSAVDRIGREELFHLADHAHTEAQGTRGSGIDVAAAVWGGAFVFQREPGHADTDAPSVTPVTLPADLAITFVYTGQSASTPELVGRVRALAARDPARHRAAFDRLDRAARELVAAITTGTADAVVVAADLYGEQMAALGREADAPIVTPLLADLAALARNAGAAAKPSGAGGGDLAVCFSAGPEATGRLHAALAQAGLAPLSVSAPAPGLTLEESQS